MLPSAEAAACAPKLVLYLHLNTCFADRLADDVTNAHLSNHSGTCYLSRCSPQRPSSSGSPAPRNSGARHNPPWLDHMLRVHAGAVPCLRSSSDSREVAPGRGGGARDLVHEDGSGEAAAARHAAARI